jgi:hypothetical protein
VTGVGVIVGVIVGVGVFDGHNPANTIVRGAPYCSTVTFLAQRYVESNVLIGETLTIPVHPVHL